MIDEGRDETAVLPYETREASAPTKLRLIRRVRSHRRAGCYLPRAYVGRNNVVNCAERRLSGC